MLYCGFLRHMSSETGTLYVYFSSEFFVGLYLSQSLNLFTSANVCKGIHSLLYRRNISLNLVTSANTSIYLFCKGIHGLNNLITRNMKREKTRNYNFSLHTSAPTCKINYVNMQRNYVNMQHNYVNTRDNYVTFLN